MHTPATMSTFPSLVSRHASRGIRPQVLSMNIPLLLAPTKEIQRPGSTPPLRSRASSSTGYRPHFTEFFDQTELITVLPLFPSIPKSNPDQSIQSGSLRSVHPSIPINRSTPDHSDQPIHQSRSIDPLRITPISPSINPDQSIQSGSLRSVHPSIPINRSTPDHSDQTIHQSRSIDPIRITPISPSINPDQSIHSGSLRSAHPSIQSPINPSSKFNQSTQIAHQPISHRSIYPTRPSTHHPNSINLPQPPINPSSKFNQSTQLAHQPISQIIPIRTLPPTNHQADFLVRIVGGGDTGNLSKQVIFPSQSSTRNICVKGFDLPDWL